MCNYKKFVICLCLTLVFTFVNVVGNASATTLLSSKSLNQLSGIQTQHPAFVQYLIPEIVGGLAESAVAAEGAAIVEGAAVAESAAVAEGAAVRGATGAATRGASTRGLVAGGSFVSSNFRTQVAVAIDEASLKQVGNIVNSGVAFYAAKDMGDALEAYKTYKQEMQKVGRPIDPCTPQIVVPENSARRFAITNSEECAAKY